MPVFYNKIKKALPIIICGAVLFTYLLLFNRFHLLHAEQMQLFRFNHFYASEIFAVPGGLSTYISQFIIQFYIFPFWGTAIIIALFFIAFLLTKKILYNYGIYSIYIALFPPILLTALQAYHNYHLETTVAYVICLFLIYFYLKISTSPLCKTIGTLTFPTIGFVSGGGFGLYIAIFFLINELFSPNVIKLKALLLFFLSLIVVLITYHFAYTYPISFIWEACIPFRYMDFIHSFSLSLVFLYLPLIPLINKKIKSFRKALVPILIISLVANYDLKTEKFFEIEHYFFDEDYSKVVDLVGKYPGNDHLVTYLGNIALSKTSQMGDHLFHYRQMFGPEGLYMVNEPLNIATLYGGALYEHLKYTSEATHWAFNGLITNKPTPRLLKRLVIYELTNGNYQVAKKYLTILSQSLFYKSWARKYVKFVKDPLLIASDKEISSLRRYSVTKDFCHDQFNLQLKSLLSSYPDNKAAFDYLISYCLLKKDLNSFLDNLPYLREFRMRQLPLHFEEALLVCKIIMPNRAAEVERFVISEETKENFKKYLAIYESKNNNDRLLYNSLLKDFKYTYWFYLDFSPYVPTDKESNVQFFPH